MPSIPDPMTPDPREVDPRLVAADEQLVERVRAGEPPSLGDPVADDLARWRADEHARPISGWLLDPAAPSGWTWHPDLAAADAGRATFTQDDGSTYRRPDPDEFDDFDDVDSTTIDDDGGPD